MKLWVHRMENGEKWTDNQQHPLNNFFLLTPTPSTNMMELRKLNWHGQSQVRGSEEENGNVLLLFTPSQITLECRMLQIPQTIDPHSLSQILATQTFTPTQNFQTYYHHQKGKYQQKKLYLFFHCLEVATHLPSSSPSHFFVKGKRKGPRNITYSLSPET